MKLVGRVRIAENGYTVSTVRITVHDEHGAFIAQVDAERNGTFEADLGERSDRRVRVWINAPGTQEAESRAHEEDVELLSDVTSKDFDVPASEFDRVAVPTSFHWAIRTLRFSGGEDITLAPNSLTLIVGTNNSGKTRALRDIATSCSFQNFSERVVVRSAVMEPERPEQWIIGNWIRCAFPLRKDGRSEVAEFGPSIIGPDHVGYFEDTSAFLVYLLDIEKRLQFSKPHQMAPISTAPANMIDHVMRNDAICDRLSEETQRAFGIGLLTEFGPHAGFRLGDRSKLPNSEDRASGAYRRALAHLPTLDSAGDGIRSFVGTLIGVEACPHPILLIDEPEAFLHPPQARYVGRLLADEAHDRQIIVATHSADVVLGALDARSSATGSAPKIQIIRVQREGDLNHATVLSASAIAELARDPQWESSELLQAMFHVGAVLCEADADRRFYRWLANDSDVAFISSNGKGGIAKASTALRLLGVPVAAIIDFDVLGTGGELRSIITALGHDPDAFLAQGSGYADIRAQLSSGREKSAGELRHELQQVLNDHTHDRKRLLGEVQNVTQSAKAGYEAKRYGIAKLTGGAHRQCRDLARPPRGYRSVCGAARRTRRLAPRGFRGQERMDR